jgi:hypothetical protein
MLALASCAVQPSDKAAEALEAKAKTGDAVAACRLVVHDFRQCVGIRERWRASSLRKRPPSCLDDPVPEEHERYLVESAGRLEGTPAQALGEVASKSTHVLESIMRLLPADDEVFSSAVGILDEIEKACPHLASGD